MINYVVHCNIISERFLWVFENSSSKIFNSISASYPLHKLIHWKSLYCGILLPFHLIFSSWVVRSIACYTFFESMPSLRSVTCEPPAQPVSPICLRKVVAIGGLQPPPKEAKCRGHFTLLPPLATSLKQPICCLLVMLLMHLRRKLLRCIEGCTLITKAQLAALLLLLLLESWKF